MNRSDIMALGDALRPREGTLPVTIAQAQELCRTARRAAERERRASCRAGVEPGPFYHHAAAWALAAEALLTCDGTHAWQLGQAMLRALAKARA